MDIINLKFDPFIPWKAILALLIVSLSILITAIRIKTRGITLRTMLILVLFIIIINPIITKENTKELSDVVLVITDLSKSQSLNERDRTSNETSKFVISKLKNLKNLDVRSTIISNNEFSNQNYGTLAFENIKNIIGDVSPERIAGFVLITDGQVHDVPKYSDFLYKAPFHVLLTGNRNESERRLILSDMPKFGIVGEDITFKVEIQDIEGFSDPVELTIRIDNNETFTREVYTNESIDITLPLTHPGKTSLEVSIPPGQNEFTLENNRKIININGIRDRLRVMLISGSPNMGLRAWRNLLNADPAIDLIHFTILRPPHKQDLTPVNELSLIPFPTKELFAANINEFDLIIFDRYSLRGILPPRYLLNIVEYIQAGGAMLDVVGESYAGPYSLATSPLQKVLPTTPTGSIILEPFQPRLTSMGKRHPVTSELLGAKGSLNNSPSWGNWFRLIDTVQLGGKVLLHGSQEKSLLVLKRIGKGRVAQLLSDHSWVWTKNEKESGPQADLLRRVVHWLMKEPDLEEDGLHATLNNGRIDIVRRQLEPGNIEARIIYPNKEEKIITLIDLGDGRSTGSITADIPGTYLIESKGKISSLSVGSIDPLEMDNVLSTDKILSSFVNDSGGKINWINNGIPEFKKINNFNKEASNEFMILRDNKKYLVTGTQENSIFPWWLSLFIASITLLGCWYREST